MNTWLLLAQQQISKPFHSRSGSLSILLCLLIWLLLLWYPVRKSAAALQNTGHTAGILNMFGLENLSYWAVPELGAYWALALYLVPLFTLFIAADLFISDRQRGSLRFLLLRCSRLQLLSGRVTGQLAVQAGLILFSLLGATLLAAVRLDNPLIIAQQLLLVMLCWLQLLIVVMPFILLMALLSLRLNKVFNAVFIAALLFLLGDNLLHWLNQLLPGAAYLAYLIPGNQLSDMLNQMPQQSWSLLLWPVLQSLVLGGGCWLTLRRQTL